MATYRFQRRSMCAPHDDPSSRSRRTASWKVVQTTLSVELSPRQPDPKNIQLSEPRAKGKTDDAHSAVPVSAQRTRSPWVITHPGLPQTRTCRRVGGQRAAFQMETLFQPPPSEPLVSLSISSGSPVIYSRSPRSLWIGRGTWMISNTVSAFRISRTLTCWSSDHLSPFAM